MVRSKTELLQCASAWINQAMADIRAQINNFMRISNVREEQLAAILGIPTRELIDILSTNCEIKLSTFAKMLIATDNVLEIKPLNETPLANAPRGAQSPIQHGGQRPTQRPMPQQQPRDAHGRFVSTRGGQSQRPMPQQMPMGQMPMGGVPVDRYGRPLPPPPSGFPMPPMDGTVPRFGGMPGMRQRMEQMQPQQQPMAEPEPTSAADELARMSRPQLIQMIRDNYWDGEIDAAIATRQEIVDFLASKLQPTAAQPQQPTAVEPQQPEVQPEVDAVPEATEDASMETFRAMLDRALEQNPNLRDVIAQYRG